MMVRWLGAIVLGAIAASGVPGASQNVQPSPAFRTGVDVVLLDVSVLDRDRRPMTGLTAADFAVLEEGRAQPIVSFEELRALEPDGSPCWGRGRAA